MFDRSLRREKNTFYISKGTYTIPYCMYELNYVYYRNKREIIWDKIWCLVEYCDKENLIHIKQSRDYFYEEYTSQLCIFLWNYFFIFFTVPVDTPLARTDTPKKYLQLIRTIITMGTLQYLHIWEFWHHIIKHYGVHFYFYFCV